MAWLSGVGCPGSNQLARKFGFRESHYFPDPLELASVDGVGDVRYVEEAFGYLFVGDSLCFDLVHVDIEDSSDAFVVEGCKSLFHLFADCP